MSELLPLWPSQYYPAKTQFQITGKNTTITSLSCTSCTVCHSVRCLIIDIVWWSRIRWHTPCDIVIAIVYIVTNLIPLFLSATFGWIQLYEAESVVSELSKWFLANKLSLSIDKICYSIFGCRDFNIKECKILILNDTILTKVDKCKYLRVMIDSDLKGHMHIDFIYSKLIKFTGIFYFFSINYVLKFVQKFSNCYTLHLFTAKFCTELKYMPTSVMHTSVNYVYSIIKY